MTLSIGDMLDGKYRVVRVIGEGGMGTVYEGEHVRIRRRVAIKTLLPSIATTEGIERFEREAQAAGQIGNEHILEVLDLGALSSGEHYMVMEYLEGETLAQRIDASGTLAAEEIAQIAQQVLRGLSAAHGAGIIHRDLKPENIFLVREKAGQRDFVKLIDFGISKFTRSGPEAMNVTRMGSFLGTPCYMSPELCRGTATADARTDIYGVGVIMYEAVSGRLPFESTTFNDLLFKVVFESPAPINTLVPQLDEAFAAIILRAMAKDPLARYESADALADELAGWMQARSIPMSMTREHPRLSAAIPAPPRVVSPSPTVRTPTVKEVPSEPILAAPRPTTPQPTPLRSDSGSRTWAASQSDPVESKKSGGLPIARIVAVTAALVVGAAILVRIAGRSSPVETQRSAPSATEARAASSTEPPATSATSATSSAIATNSTATAAVPSVAEPPRGTGVASATPTSVTPTSATSTSATIRPVATAPRPTIGPAAGHLRGAPSATSTAAIPTSTKTTPTNEDEIPAVR